MYCEPTLVTNVYPVIVDMIGRNRLVKWEGLFDPDVFFLFQQSLQNYSAYKARVLPHNVTILEVFVSVSIKSTLFLAWRTTNHTTYEPWLPLPQRKGANQSGNEFITLSCSGCKQNMES